MHTEFQHVWINPSGNEFTTPKMVESTVNHY